MRRAALLVSFFTAVTVAACSAANSPQATPPEAAPPEDGGASSEATAPPVDAAPPEDSGGDPHAAEHAAIRAFVAADIAKYDIPGAQVALVEDGKLAYRTAVGVKKHGGSDLVTDATRFRVASLSKMILGATALSLVEENKLDLAKSVTDYVPTYALKAPFDPSTIQVKHLLTHTSGLPDMKVSFRTCPGVTTLAAYFGGTEVAQPLWVTPGSVWDYSNRGYAVAGYVLETIAGKSYSDLATERVLAKAGMTRATFDLGVVMAEDHAVGWAPDPTTGVLSSYEPNAFDCIVSRPPAGISATASDYAHFVETLYAGGGAMLSPASVKAFETGHALSDAYPNDTYAYGLHVHDGYKGLHILRHTGELDTGYLSSVWMVPEQRFAVVILYNGMGRAPDESARFAVDAVLGLAKKPSPDYTTSPTGWTKYTGTYVDAFRYGTITVSLDGTTLRADIPDLSVSGVAMKQLEGDVFSLQIGSGSPTSVTFYPDTATGVTRWFVTRSGVGTKQ